MSFLWKEVQVVGCHMGSRGVDNPIVRYKTQERESIHLVGVETVEEFAQTALDALKAGEAWLGKASKCSEVWLDGQILKGEWKNSGRPGPPPAGGPRNEAGRSDDFAQAARVA